jgi:Late exocytosis, associated with Golgi transport
MTTLQAIGFTVAGGTVVLSSCVVLFGVALQRHSVHVAPRASARPPQVIYNRHASPGHSQHRGNPFYGWIQWCHQLSYETLLKGVPGTGTRKGGASGTMLHVTLDGIVLLRFHVLGRRISMLATLLCCGLLLPLYTSAPCLPDFLASNKYMSLYECNATLTTFRQTTLSHVPDLQPDFTPNARAAILSRMYVVVLAFWIVTLYAFYLLRQEWVELLALRRIHYLESTRGGEKQSSQEWTRRLAYGGRRRQQPLPQPSSSNAADNGSSTNSNSNSVNRSEGGLGLDGRDLSRSVNADDDYTDEDSDDDENDEEEEEPHLTHRRPWIPHPEQPDTVPNVEPYSLLVGHLPFPPVPQSSRGGGDVTTTTTTRANGSSALPTSEMDADIDDVEDGLPSSSASLDDECTLPLSDIVQYQLQHVSRLLEAALPQEPGYSSPIAAVTIVPPAGSMGRCWRKWYAAASALRRLDFLQSVWESRIGGMCGGAGEAALPLSTEQAVAPTTAAPENSMSYVGNDPRFAAPSTASPAGSVRLPVSSPLPPLSLSSPHNTPSKSPGRPSPSPPSSQPRSRRQKQRQQQHMHRASTTSKYLFQVFGGHYNPALEDDIRANVASAFGPEQMAVFSRELAQSASNCCPNGMRENYMRKLPDSELKDRIADAEMDLHRAVQDLQRSQEDVSTRPVPYRVRRSRRPLPVDGVAHHRLFRPTLEFLQNFRTRLRPRSEHAALEMTELTRDESDSEAGAPTSIRNIDRGDSNNNGARSNGVKSNGDSLHQGDNGAAVPVRWVWPSLSHLRDRQTWKELWEIARREIARPPGSGLRSKLPEVLLSENSYAILTFTSRQAAAAARQYLSSRCELSMHDIPIPPLADAAPCTLMPFRFVCRPVTVTAKDWHKNVRLYL